MLNNEYCSCPLNVDEGTNPKCKQLLEGAGNQINDNEYLSHPGLVSASELIWDMVVTVGQHSQFFLPRIDTLRAKHYYTFR